ncbi:MAG: hypothetical protein HY287_16870 [Planctomycetes bacterium]|nr:hypothetical protein [Planctomycetota bacterium]
MNNSKQARQESRAIGRFVELNTTWTLRRRCIVSHPFLLVTAISTAFLALGADHSAFGQGCNSPPSPCPDATTCPVGCTVDCDPSLAHGKRAHAACPQAKGVGDKLSCTGTTEYADELLDVIRYEQASNTVKGAIRVPETGNLPIAALFGNAVCTDANGACNPSNGSNCAFPCLVAAGGVAYFDSTSGLTLQGIPSDGGIQVKDEQYVIKHEDIGSLECQFTFVSTDLGTSCCSNTQHTCDTTNAVGHRLVHCGNGVCEANEDCSTCPQDCFGVQPGCGNGICEPGLRENCLNCPVDCNGGQIAKPSAQFCCGYSERSGAANCNDVRCVTHGFTCSTESVASCCGDSVCDGTENGCNCAVDCGHPPTREVPGATCADGIDNDCDGLIDGDDPDCTCGARGTPCTKGTSCCSGVCLTRGRCR